MIEDLREGDTLNVYLDDRLMFRSGGSWLHPLFELEDYLASGDLEPGRLRIVDKVTGKAAALLVKRMGIRKIHSGVMSELARGVCENSGIIFSAELFVDRIECRTEELLADIDDVDEAYAILAERAGRSETRGQ